MADASPSPGEMMRPPSSNSGVHTPLLAPRRMAGKTPQNQGISFYLSI